MLLFPWLWIMAGGAGTPPAPASGVAFDLALDPAVAMAVALDPRAGFGAALRTAVTLDCALEGL